MTASAPFVARALAYSGGLDTSIIVPWLKEHYGCEVVCYCSDVGQGAGAGRARGQGAQDRRERGGRRGPAAPVRARLLLPGAARGRDLRRHLSARHTHWRARSSPRGRCGAPARPGATRSPTAAPARATTRCASSSPTLALAPQLPVIAPWREWDIVSREDAIRYAERHGVPIAQTKSDLYSRDANLWHISHEGGPLEDPAVRTAREHVEAHRLARAPARDAGDGDDRLRRRPAGAAQRQDARSRWRLVTALNQIAGRHGVGRTDLVESRLVGMKSRGAYETPAGTVLYEALEDLCRAHAPARPAAHARRAGAAHGRADLQRALVLAAAPRAPGVRRHRAPGDHRRGDGRAVPRPGRRRSRARARSRSTAPISPRST